MNWWCFVGIIDHSWIVIYYLYLFASLFNFFQAQITDRVRHFLSEPVSVQVTVARNYSLIFPAITICNKVGVYLVSTLGFLAEISFTPLLHHPGGSLGCPERQTSSRNYNLFVLSAVLQPKWNFIKKTYKNYQNPVKSYWFLGYYQSL